MEFPCMNDEEYDEPVVSLPRRRQTPSMPNMYLPTRHSHQDILDFTTQRPHLGSLDLASPLLRPMSRAVTARRPAIDSAPLTPPLTPESAASRASSTTELFISRHPSTPTDDERVGLGSWSHGPQVIRSSFVADAASAATAFEALAASCIADEPSRFLLVLGVPSNASTQYVKQSFQRCGDIRGIFVRFQADHGAIILAYYDSRHSVNALKTIRSEAIFEGRTLSARFISPHHLLEYLPRPEFISGGEASLHITAQSKLDQSALQNLLSSFGDIAVFSAVNSTSGASQTFQVEYFDCRTSLAVFTQLNNRTILETRIRVSFVDPQAHSIALRNLQSSQQSLSGRSSSSEHPVRRVATAVRPAQLRLGLHHANSDNNLRERAAVAAFPRLTPVQSTKALHRQPSMTSIQPQTPTTASSNASSSPNITYVSSPPSSVHSPVIEQHLQFPPETKNPDMSTTPAYYPAQREQDSVNHQLRYDPAPFAAVSQPPPTFAQQRMQRPHLPHLDTTTIESYYHHHHVPVTGPGVPIHPMYCAPPLLGHTSAEVFSPTVAMFSPTSVSEVYTPSSTSDMYFPSGSATPVDGFSSDQMTVHGMGNMKTERDNAIDVERVEMGLDTRTTVMIKNIPNKMSDKNLIDFIADVCPRRIDFLYLRMDFVNNCNVGYAFVNFITVQDLITFCKARLGVKWNMYQSEKVLNMTYANYQGKEALVEKFKNSCIMDERESWRPKIFYSSGPHQGLSEPFPAPTHLRRKERSHANARERILYANNPNRHTQRAIAA